MGRQKSVNSFCSLNNTTSNSEHKIFIDFQHLAFVSWASSFSSVAKGKCLHLQKESTKLWAGFTWLACPLPSNCHCYYTMQHRMDIKQRRAEYPFKALQAYNRQSTATTTITSKSFGKFRLHFLSIMIPKESDEFHHSMGILIDGAHPGPKTDRDYLGRYCPKTFKITNTHTNYYQQLPV